MNLEELNIILSRGENTRTEYKEARESLPGSLYPTVVSFLNREGGVIVLGADDDGRVTGINLSGVEQFKKDMVTALNNKEIINPPVNFPFYELEKDGNTVVCMKIPVSSQIHSYKGVIFDREDNKFRTIIPLSCPVFGEKAELVLSFAGLDIHLLPEGLLDEMKQLALFPSLAKISDPDTFLFQKGSSWAEKGVRLQSARINKINNLQFDDFQKGSSWAEKGARLLPKRTLTILRLLMICLLPAKVEEMRQILSFGSRDKLRELYLNPLRKEGMIETTVKDKLKSPEQKYILSEKGRLFLGGFEII